MTYAYCKTYCTVYLYQQYACYRIVTEAEKYTFRSHTPNCLSYSSLSVSSLHKPSSQSSCWPCIEGGIRAGSADSLMPGTASVLSKLRASRARLTRARVSSTLALAPLSCMPGSSMGVTWPEGPVMEIEGGWTPAASTSDWRDSQSSVAWHDSQSSVITSG